MTSSRRRRRRTAIGLVSKRVPTQLRVAFQSLIARLLRQGIREGPDLQARLVDIARPANSIFHDMYEWNNSVAGEKYRMEQARFYVMSIGIRIHINNTIGYITLKANSSVKLPQNVSRNYFTLGEATTRANVRIALRLQMRTDILVFMQKYSNHQKFFGSNLTRVLNDMRVLLRQIR